MKALTLLLCLLLAVPALAGMGTSVGHDLDALWAQAQADYDLTREDAVILVHDMEVTVADNGDITTRVHTVVWIGTSQGIRGYADLRVPWNSATSTLDVELLRTWREERWWPDAERISDTAVVHTLPYALRTAYDYGAMRETMLLHDGVELPCIMETAYTITERGRPLADGVFVFSQADPAVLVEYSVALPGGAALSQRGLNGADEPTQEGVTWAWSASGVSPLGWPHTADAADHEPAVVWTTAADAAGQAAPWAEAFAAAVAEYDPTATAAGLVDAIAGAAGGAAAVRATAGHVAASVRAVHHPTGPWLHAPRPASRVWDTAYGHTLDLAVIHAAVLGSLGHTVEPRFVQGAGRDALRAVVAGHLVLEVTPHGAPAGEELYLDPATGEFLSRSGLGGLIAVDGRPVPENPTAAPANLDLTITLGPDGDGGWQGRCRVEADGPLAPATGAAAPGQVTDQLGAMAGSVLNGAEIGRVAVQRATAGRFAAEAEISLAPAGQGKWQVVVGSPTGGLPGALPRDVNLADERRSAPVLFAGPGRQQVTVRFDLTGQTAAHLPAARTDVRDSGRFAVSAAVADGWLTYRRELEIEGPVPAALWPELRALLLEESAAANGTLVIAPVP